MLDTGYQSDKEGRSLLFNSFNLSAFSFLFHFISLFSQRIHIIFIGSVRAGLWQI